MSAPMTDQERINYWWQRATVAESKLTKAEAVVRASAIYRPDHETYGDEAWDNIETIDIRPVLAAFQEGEL